MADKAQFRGSKPATNIKASKTTAHHHSSCRYREVVASVLGNAYAVVLSRLCGSLLVGAEHMSLIVPCFACFAFSVTQLTQD